MERRHRFEPALGGHADRLLAGDLEVVTELHDFGAERSHRCVLLDAVAVRHEDRHRHPVRTTGEREALAVVAAGGADDAGHLGPLTNEPIHVHQAATHLEGADRRVVLVLDHHRRSGDLVEHRPPVLRRRRNVTAHDRRAAASSSRPNGRDDPTVAHRTTARSVTTLVTRDVMRLGRQRIDQLLVEAHTDDHAGRRHRREQAVVPATALAEPVTAVGEGEPRHDHEIGPRGVDAVLGDGGGGTRVATPVDERRRLGFAWDRVEDQHASAASDLGQ